MDIAKFGIKTLADAGVRVGAGASGLGLILSLGISTARNLLLFSKEPGEETASIKHSPSGNQNGQPVAQA